jgi:hypothetical protein
MVVFWDEVLSVKVITALSTSFKPPLAEPAHHEALN